jgi:hypothetical protein
LAETNTMPRAALAITAAHAPILLTALLLLPEAKY